MASHILPRTEHPDPAIQALLQAAYDKAAQQMNCVHEYALRQQRLSPAAFFCRICGHPFVEAMESLDDCLQIEPQVYVPKRFYRQDG